MLAMKSCKRSQTDGFTLIELMSTLAVAAVLLWSPRPASSAFSATPN
jgi:prepilin-type N-terminal cleavage/methylation domain-containing protein